MKIIKRNAILSLLCLISFFGCVCPMALAAEDGPSAYEEALLSLINEARQNPLAVAASMGMDTEKILQDLPELETILREGLPAVIYNGKLYEAARAHTRDMFSNSYYSHDSLDGQGYEARIQNSGYPALESGESLGMLAFANFIAPGDAARRLFEYMFWDELDPNRTEKRNILDPNLMEVGVSIDSGALSLGGSPWNVYLATCDYGSVISGPEARLLRMINKARENPLDAAAALGMDRDQVLSDFPEYHDMLTQGLPPLALDANLTQAARAHTQDMLLNGYFSGISLDGRTVEDRIRETGYDPEAVGEQIRLQCMGHDLSDMETLMERMVQMIYEVWLTREFDRYNLEPRNILNAGFREVGVSLLGGVSEKLGGICGNNVLLMAADFGARWE